MTSAHTRSPLSLFHPAVQDWFRASFEGPTEPQALGWPPILRGRSTLLLAPTGTGKTLAAFLGCLDRLMFEPVPARRERCRVLYVSPLKALAVDVERNLRSPLAGIARAARARGDRFEVPTVAVRTGDTPSSERARFLRSPADILITTPESLYLLLTSQAREVLRSIDTVIVDEIHALVPTKRGAHFALSLERLEGVVERPLQRIGLSATQRPLDEIARFLGGVVEGPEDAAGAGRPGSPEGHAGARGEGSPGRRAPAASFEEGDPSDRPMATLHGEFSEPSRSLRHRPVVVVDAGARKPLELRIEVPVEDMSKLGQVEQLPTGPAAQGLVRPSIWTAIHPRLLELVRAHTSTIVFVNSRRVAERLAGALNELAGEQLVYAHHGSVARAQRREIEDKLKSGQVRGLVATSSLELGIDMGAIDLVVQIEAPPSVASGMQRIGRAGHQVGVPSRGVLFPKYRADLVACAALAEAMHEGRVEATRYPRNPLDVLAQQLVAMASTERWEVDALYEAVRRAAPFAELSRRVFEGVLDMLSGRYASDDFAELRPRLIWDRVSNTVVAREGARRVAIVNGGTIPDRGLYGVFVAGAGKGAARVGELDEEMVFESRVGEVFLLGATSWRIEEITFDRVLVSPAPGEPGKMPFWHGDSVGRPLELGQRIGKLMRELREVPKPVALDRLQRRHDLDPRAAENLLAYLDDQAAATEAVPDDRTVIVERTRDELGDWRVCVLSPLGGRVHAPWAMAVQAKVRDERGLDVETMWTDDGFVVRFPESDVAPEARLLLPAPDELERLVLGQLGATSLFAAKFREIAARALLLPKRRPGGRAPLWQTRKRASDLLAVASRFPSFPMLLEAYRECVRDIFDLPSLQAVLRRVANRSIRVVTRDSQTPSPFASAILFGFVANYLYEGDAPLAERRAQALAIDHAQLRELLGEAELRELLDPDALADVVRGLQRLDERGRARGPDELHDLLRRLGDLSLPEIRQRASAPECDEWLRGLLRARRAVEIGIEGERRYVAVETAARYRDALGAVLPPGLPEAFLERGADPLLELATRFSRTHGPFTTEEFADRYGFGRSAAEATLRRAEAAGRLLEGAFLPGGVRPEWCDPEVLRTIRRRSLARLRQEVEPVEPRALARMMLSWQGVSRRRRGMDALLDVIEQLQGTALPASIFETEILARRVERYSSADLDALAAAGEVVWCGIEPLGERDGRLALYLTDQLPRLWRPPVEKEGDLSPRERAVVEHLRGRGASFFEEVHAAAGGGFPGQTVDALWDLVWRGWVTNDLFYPLRAFAHRPAPSRGRRGAAAHGLAFRSRRQAPPSAEGRWTLVQTRVGGLRTDTLWSAATAQQLLARYGVVTREMALSEGVRGGFGALYEVFRALEESGRIRRGYFVSGVGAMQFALPPVVDLLRSHRDEPLQPEAFTLSSVDPANPYGTLLRWPVGEGGAGRGPTRAVGTHVVLVSGALVAHVGRGGRQLWTFLPEDEPDRSTVAHATALQIAELAARAMRGSGFSVAEIDGADPRKHPLTPYLLETGFAAGTEGLHYRPPVPPVVVELEARRRELEEQEERLH